MWNRPIFGTLKKRKTVFEWVCHLLQTSFAPCQAAVWTNWSYCRRRESLFYWEIMSSYSHLILESQEMNTLPCWQVVTYMALTMRCNAIWGIHGGPHWCSTISVFHELPESLILVANNLVAAVTYLISDERRANISNTIKHEINWHRPVNCSNDPKVIAHKAAIALKWGVLLQVWCTASEYISHLHNKNIPLGRSALTFQARIELSWSIKLQSRPNIVLRCNSMSSNLKRAL